MMRCHFRRAIFLLLLGVMALGFLPVVNGLALADGSGATYIISMDRSSTDWIRVNDQNVIRLVNQLLEAGVDVQWALDDFSVGNHSYPAGTFYIQAPFTTETGISDSTVMAWLQWEAKKHRVYTIRKTTTPVEVRSRSLVLPRIVLFYDRTTYENSLVHYTRFSDMGFKVRLANSVDICSKDWNDPDSIFSRATVFAMPGGAMHFWAFETDDDRAKAIQNIQQFVENGGGYVGVCAGASETLALSPYPYLEFVDANYHSEWFTYDDPSEGDWDWRQLIGPVYLDIAAPDHPVMFGYGPDAKRPGYGPKTTMYYYGGPAMWDIGDSVTVLARYGAPVTQRTPEKVKDIWGAAASVTQDHGKGKIVIFGPHPEWPGPAGRMYAQALYYVSSVPVESHIERSSSKESSNSIDSNRVKAITSSVQKIKPMLASSTRIAAEMVNLRAGDHYHPLGLWYDESIMAYGQAMYSHVNRIKTDAVKFQYEYKKLSLLREMLRDDPELRESIDYAQAMIEAFFESTENLPPEPHVIEETDWTGAGPFEPFTSENDAKRFEDLVSVFDFLLREIKTVDLPCALDYAESFRKYERARVEHAITGTTEAKEKMDTLYVEMSASWPAGPLYKSMYTMRHTLDIMQFKTDYHLLNILTIGAKTREVLSMTNFAAAQALGSHRYALASTKAFISHPIGGVLP